MGCGPLRLDLDRALGAGPVVVEAALKIEVGGGGEASFDGVAVDVLDDFGAGFADDLFRLDP